MAGDMPILGTEEYPVGETAPGLDCLGRRLVGAKKSCKNAKIKRLFYYHSIEALGSCLFDVIHIFNVRRMANTQYQ